MLAIHASSVTVYIKLLRNYTTIPLCLSSVVGDNSGGGGGSSSTEIVKTYKITMICGFNVNLTENWDCSI